MKASERATAEGILFTNECQLTMAQLYYRMGLHERRTQFDYFYRTNPSYDSHQAGYGVNAPSRHGCSTGWGARYRIP